jgi:DNA mismatch endonuclease (patch repair protein)
MTDVHNAQQRSYNMSKVKRYGTSIELKVKNILEHKGFLYQPNTYGRPDFVNFKRKVVIFIDGCFWHCCPVCFKIPKSNVKFWLNKLNQNAIRDLEVRNNYKLSGWKVIRIWEHSLRSAAPAKLKRMVSI